MKKILVLAVLALALPMAVFASSSIDYSNSGGTLTASAAGGLTLSGSDLSEIRGFPGGIICSSGCGSITFTTGALLSGSLAMGGTFANGGSFTIMGSGMNGAPSGVLFTGTFSGPNPATWTLNTLADGTHLSRKPTSEEIYRDSQGRIRTELPFCNGVADPPDAAVIGNSRSRFGLCAQPR